MFQVAFANSFLNAILCVTPASGLAAWPYAMRKQGLRLRYIERDAIWGSDPDFEVELNSCAVYAGNTGRLALTPNYHDPRKATKDPLCAQIFQFAAAWRLEEDRGATGDITWEVVLLHGTIITTRPYCDLYHTLA